MILSFHSINDKDYSFLRYENILVGSFLPHLKMMMRMTWSEVGKGSGECYEAEEFNIW